MQFRNKMTGSIVIPQSKFVEEQLKKSVNFEEIKVKKTPKKETKKK